VTALKRKNAVPADVIRDLIKLYGINQRYLVNLWGVSPGYVCDILAGRRGISPRVALLLEATFGDSAEFWLKLQMKADLNCLRNTMQDEMNRIGAVANGFD
jgi:HTH-type transcriptional regulator/antitoxin HigA